MVALRVIGHNDELIGKRRQVHEDSFDQRAAKEREQSLIPAHPARFTAGLDDKREHLLIIIDFIKD